MSLRMRKLFLIILIVNLVVACGTTRLSTAPTITQTRETAALKFTSSPRPIVTHFPTLDPLTPSAIAQFFATNEAKLAAKEAASPTPQITPTVSFESCKGWGDLTSDGKWAICERYADPIIFINQSEQTWQFSYQSFYKQSFSQHCTELLHTTNGGMYIYFSLLTDCAMIEPGFPEIMGVFRINLTNGKVDKVLRANYDFQNYHGQTYTVAISPTGRRLAYIAHHTHPLVLNILDLNTGEISSFQLDPKYLNGGLFKWSQDGTKLAFKLSSRSEEYGDDLISFAFLDLQKSDSLVVFLHEKSFFWITAQMEFTELGLSVEAYGESPLFYDSRTGVVSTVSK